MRRHALLSILAVLLCAPVAAIAAATDAAPDHAGHAHGDGAHATAAPAAATGVDWHLNATIIEACSCPMFCQCYFNLEPAAPAGGHAGHGGHEGHEGQQEAHYCRFNNAFQVNKGHHGNVKLDGAKFWVAGDLGGDFSHGQMDWAVVTFDKAMTPQQREAIGAILGHVYPVKWNSLTTGEGEITWVAGAESSHALLDGGKSAEVRLKRFPGMKKDQPVVMHNLIYWGVPRNDGFVMMPNEVEAWRLGEKTFEFKGTNGFMITFDISSKDVAGAAKKS